LIPQVKGCCASIPVFKTARIIAEVIDKIEKTFAGILAGRLSVQNLKRKRAKYMPNRRSRPD
jgi:hypothetical protein